MVLTVGCIISVLLVIADGWCSNKKGVGKTGGIWWKDKKDALVSKLDIDGRNIYKYENDSEWKWK